jgi:hypothetical protein
VPFDAVWIEAPAEALLARVEARCGDASDADATVVQAQLDGAGAPDWPVLPNGGIVEDGVEALARRLRLGT